METTEISALVDLREFQESDRAFVMATWLRGLYYGNSWFTEIDKPIFMDRYWHVLNALLKKPGVVVVIACLKEDPDTILGYAAIEPEASVLHWVFVKEAYRKLGVTKLLFKKEDLKTITHLTKLGKILKPKHVKFNPFI